MGAWGLVPLAFPALALVAARAGALAFAGDRASHRAVGGVTAAIALVVAATAALGVARLLRPAAFVAVLGTAVVALALASRRRTLGVAWREAWSRDTALVSAVALVAIAVAVVEARWLPVWQWDALGYHLPYVDFALVAHGLDGVPRDIPYISTYPHDVELCMIALRALLPDDRLVDLAQIPFALAGAVATAGIARLGGAARPHALAAGATWIVVPAVFLQMPTDYIDVATAAFFLLAAYFLLADPTPRTLIAAGVGVGLYLGSKPNAPLAASVLLLVLVVRGVRSGHRAAACLGVALALAFGCEAYVANLARYGNPVWPIRIDVGPVHFPGTTAMKTLLQAGAAAPRLHGPVWSRVPRSWIALGSAPVFDMRIGGYGPIFLAALPLAGLELLRRRSVALVAIVAASLASPDPAVARYVLAFPALVIALAAPRVSSLRAPAGAAVGIAVAVAAAWQVVYAVPGLTGEGPPLRAYASMTDAQRRVAVGAAGPPTDVIAARARVGAGETFAIDPSFDLAHLAWTPDLAYPVVYVTERMSPDAAGALFEREHARVVAAGAGHPAGDWIRRHPEQFELLFTCRAMPCAVYLRR